MGIPTIGGRSDGKAAVVGNPGGGTVGLEGEGVGVLGLAGVAAVAEEDEAGDEGEAEEEEGDEGDEKVCHQGCDGCGVADVVSTEEALNDGHC